MISYAVFIDNFKLNLPIKGVEEIYKKSYAVGLIKQKINKVHRDYRGVVISEN